MAPPQEGKKGGREIIKEEVGNEGNANEMVENRGGGMCDLLKLKMGPPPRNAALSTGQTETPD